MQLCHTMWQSDWWKPVFPVGALYTYSDAKFKFRARKNPMVAVYNVWIEAGIAQYPIIWNGKFSLNALYWCYLHLTSNQSHRDLWSWSWGTNVNELFNVGDVQSHSKCDCGKNYSHGPSMTPFRMPQLLVLSSLFWMPCVNFSTTISRNCWPSSRIDKRVFQEVL